MSNTDFQNEMTRILQSKELLPKDPSAVPVRGTQFLDSLDSLDTTEIIGLAETYLGVSIAFGEVKQLKTYGDLLDLIESKR